MFVVGVVLFLGSGWLWWRNVANSPQQVFSDMLENSLRTQSFAKQINQDNGQRNIQQDQLITFGAEPRVRIITTISESENTTVKTESIGTLSGNFIRYNELQTDQTGPRGKPLDFSEVVGVWGDIGSEESSGRNAGGLFSESVLWVVPVGLLPHSDRQELLDFIHENDIYQINYLKVERTIKGNRPVYVYDVTVSAQDYVSLLQKFEKMLGMNQLASLDIDRFKDNPPIKLDIEVDVWSRQLTGLTFDDGRTERYGSYGQEVQYAIPEAQTSLDGLQRRLQQVQEVQ